MGIIYIVYGAALGFLYTRLYIFWSRNSGLLRKNYKEEAIPYSAGIVYILVILSYPFFAYEEFRIMISFFGIIFIGIMDDFFGTSAYKGFKGHFKALKWGVLTTGFYKLLMISIISIFYSSNFHLSIIDLIFNSVFLSSMANTFNLLDLKPGRAFKVYFTFLAILLFYNNNFNNLFFIILGCSMVLFYFDLNRLLMLGDSGSNFIGFYLGVYLLETVRIYILPMILLLISLNFLSEYCSFSKIIAGNRILKYLDSLGRDD
jgi:UDP-N-acetylmuramyl pentapeptide phosphotransferase/UDP-N-acetylglucosamine-1-phosphate transferase